MWMRLSLQSSPGLCLRCFLQPLLPPQSSLRCGTSLCLGMHLPACQAEMLVQGMCNAEVL